MGPCWALGLLLALAPILLGLSPARQPTLPQWQGFQAQQFQGDWLVLGLAGNSLTRKDRALLNPFLITFELNEKGQLEVSNAMTRGKRCDTWNYVLTPESQPGHFRVDGLTGVSLWCPPPQPGPESEVVQVVEGDYEKFALVVSQRLTGTQTILRISLLAVRIWQLPSEVKNKFFCLARSQGLKWDNIVFPDLTEWSPGPHSC
ncbi:epididymal-specific lipocalin-12 [Ochotona curzoniae]|uniref:epididymal-specific lipocalin-12 n=1 Tax=Ochotona curzoniae TaxID=130825 RepID=UPI001B353C61|nr:epididymal-specific lipocalin-12 [Ochotona curzoniae]